MYITKYQVNKPINHTLVILQGAAQRLHKELKNYYSCIKGKKCYFQIKIQARLHYVPQCRPDKPQLSDFLII